ncbi:hypothetical protein JCM3775_003230 [Rhodotorula graminis]
MPHPSQLNRRAGGKKGPRQVNSKRQPKVTLRPAPARDPAAAAAAAAYEADSGVSDDDADDYGGDHDVDRTGEPAYGYREALRGERKPLEGLRVSVSGCDGRKEDLLALAETFGAERHGGLQEDTTHLVTDSPAGKKYDVALQRRMHVMKSSWLPAVRDAWVSGEDVDFHQLELDHAMPPLKDVVACLTGFAKGEYKEELKRLLVLNGAKIAIKLDSRVTHLLVASPSSPHSQTPTSSKLLHVRKNRHCLHEDIVVVWEGWAREAVKYGGIRAERVQAWEHNAGGAEPVEDVTWQVDVAPPRCRSTVVRARPVPLAARQEALGGAAAGPVASSSRTIVPVPGTYQPRRSFKGYDTALLDNLDSAADPAQADTAAPPAFDLAHGKVLKKRRRVVAADTVPQLLPSASQQVAQQAQDDSQALLEAFGASQLPAAGDSSRFADADTTGLQSVAELLAARARAVEEHGGAGEGKGDGEMAMQLVPGQVEMQLVPKSKSVIKALSSSRQGSFVHAPAGERARRLPAAAPSRTALVADVPGEGNAGHDDSAFFDSAPALAPVANDKTTTTTDSGVSSSGASSVETVFAPMFAGKTVALMELKSPRVSAIRRVIDKCSGVCIDNANDDELAQADFVIVDYVEPPARFANNPDPRIRTVCWIELCIFHDQLLDLADRVLERPISFACPVPGLDAVRVHFSGFGPEDDPAMHHLRRYCTAIGAVYSPYMDRSTTHLVVCALDDDRSLGPEDLDPAQFPKVAKAREWGLTVCSLGALRQMVERRAEEVRREAAGEQEKEEVSHAAEGPCTTMRVAEITGEVDEQSVHGPLGDCVVFFSSKVDVDRQALASIVQDLGGVAARQYSQSVTHFVFAGVKATESFKDFKLAKADGAHIVHPRWIEECGRAQARISENDFPHTFDAKKGGQLFDAGMSLVGVASSPRGPPVGASSQVPHGRRAPRSPLARTPSPAARPQRVLPERSPTVDARRPVQVEAGEQPEGARTEPSSPAPSPGPQQAVEHEHEHELGGFDGLADTAPRPALDEHAAETSSPRQPLPRSEPDVSSDFELPPLRSEHRPPPPVEDPGRNMLREQTSRLLAQLSETSVPQAEKPGRARGRTALSRGKSSGTISLTTSKQPSPLAAVPQPGHSTSSTTAAAAGRVPGHAYPLDPSQATQDESLYVVYDNVAEAAAREQIRRALAGGAEAPPEPVYQDPVGSRTRRGRATRQ